MKEKIKKIACAEVNFSTLPAEWPLLKMGENPLTIKKPDAKGNPTDEDIDVELSISEADASEIMQRFEKKGIKIPIDANHTLSFLASETKTDEDDLILVDPTKTSAVLGFGELEKRPDAIYMVHVKWNELGEKLLKAKQYTYFSPVLKGINSKSPLRITSVSLTNQPRLDQLESLIASEAEPNIQPQPKENPTMDKLKETLAKLFGVEIASLETEEGISALIARIKWIVTPQES